MIKRLAAGFVAATMAFGAAGAASAATIDFDNGSSIGNDWYEDGFVFQTFRNGSPHNSAVSTPNGCVENGANTGCLLLPNNNNGRVVKMSRVGGGTFSLLSFSFDGRDGQSPALFVSETDSGGTGFTEGNNSNVMTPTGPLSQFMNVSMIFFIDAQNGSSRVDNIEVSVPNVPIPAAGFLLVVGLGTLGMMGRRKTA